MNLLYQLRLFPAVFLPPPAFVDILGEDFGKPCIATMVAASSVLHQLPDKVVHGTGNDRMTAFPYCITKHHVSTSSRISLKKKSDTKTPSTVRKR
jgi:hypothetical protein